MKLKLTWLMTLFMAFVMQFSFAQEKTVTGTVTSAVDGLPLPGVNVIVQGTSRGVQTDFDGNYSIKASEGETLVFSFLGMKEATVVVGSSNTVNISMQEDVESLEEIVVTGYTTTKVKRANVAASTIKAETISDRPNISIAQTLQGQVSGLNISTASGQPGANSLIRLRGVSSLNGNTEPLFIIDGAPVDEDNFRSLNPNDIAKVDVLKDAGATAIYGNRGANGVIIITTKTAGFDSGVKVNYQGTYGYTELIQPDYNLFDSRGLLAFEKQRNLGRGATLTDAEIAAYDVDTDWTDVFFRTGTTKSHNLSFSQGGQSLTSYTSLGYTDQEGILVNSGLQRFNFRNNLNGKSSDGKFTYNTNLTLNFSNTDDPGSVGTGGVNQNFILGALKSVPYLSPDDYEGPDVQATLLNTPLFLLDKQRYFVREVDEIKVVGTIGGRYQITDEWHARIQSSIDYTHTTSLTSQDPVSFNSVFFLESDQDFGGFETRASARTFTFNNLVNLGWEKGFGSDEKHSIIANAYLEYVKSHFDSFGLTQNGLVPGVYSPGSGVAYVLDNPVDDYYVPTVNTSEADYGLFSYFADLDYDFDSKYGLKATVRRDASSRFVGDNKWGTFWSIAGRWNISDESFMDGVGFVNLLKLRASYGTNGNDRIAGTYFGGLSTTETLYNAGPAYGDFFGVVFGGYGNESLKWETVKTLNIGLDFRMFKNRLRGAVDFYERTTEDLFSSARISESFYGQSLISSNIGSLKNTGVDLNLSYDLIQGNADGDLSLTLNFVGNYNKNEVIELSAADGRIDGTNTITYEGGPIGEYFMVPYIGVNPSNGNLLYLDINDQITENPTLDDRRFTGKDNIPDFQGSFGFDISYKGFFLQNQWNYVTGIDRIDFDQSGYLDPADIGTFNVSRDLTRAWTTDNRITDIPSLGATNLNSASGFDDRFLKESDFLRLRSLTFGYDVPSKHLEKVFLSGVRVFANGENLLTLSKWKGADPESPDASAQYEYPTPRIITFGVNLEF